MTRLRTTLTLTAVVAALAAGAALAAAAAAAGDEPKHETQLKLVLAHDGAHEKIVLDNLHDLALGESRSFSTESGKAAIVTRTEKGFEVDLDGQKITIGDEPDAALGGDGDVMVFHKKIEIGEGDDAKTMVWHSAEAGDGHQVKVIHRIGGPGENFAFAAGPQIALHMEKMADAWIERLRQSADFQALDAATRDKVEAALRSTAPKPMGEAGSTVVLELDDDQQESGAQ
jgi:hypothetical protein